MVILLQERLTIDTIREMFASLARSIGHLHAKKRIHGDIKPLNIVRHYDGVCRALFATVVSYKLSPTPLTGSPPSFRANHAD